MPCMGAGFNCDSRSGSVYFCSCGRHSSLVTETVIAHGKDDVQRKFGTLKSTFQRELRKIQSTPSGSAGSVELKWEYFKSCSFMIPVNSCTPRRTSFDTSEPQEPETIVLSISSENYEEGTSNSNWGESDGAQPQVCNIPDLTPPQTRSTSSLSVHSDNYFDGTHVSTPSSSSSIFQRSDTRVKKEEEITMLSRR
ncbi:uncharacterized protein LOC135195418 [Macrobrachium nipponense]|uniref:uncharacterized protein LOC135195418 n=1 Tax=Macrobrachium nipponense TaxID=159736 RepID=UPI0030C7E897